jgi:hypothetical protein
VAMMQGPVRGAPLCRYGYGVRQRIVLHAHAGARGSVRRARPAHAWML